jgi:DNA-binding transcriptional ArsR family regulator
MNLIQQNETVLTIRDERLVFAMQLLGDKTRYKLFKILLQDNNLCVNEIAGKLDVSSSAISQHFRMFEAANMVDKRREGLRICYSLRKDDTLITMLTWLITDNKGDICATH